MSLLLFIVYTCTISVWSWPPIISIDNAQVDLSIDDLTSVLCPSSYPRHRKPWHLTTGFEKNLYINGLKTLSSQGKLQVFTQQHASTISGKQAHSTSAFLPWHRYFLWELETQIRNLGGKYQCFVLPYWYALISSVFVYPCLVRHMY